ncbi:MAG: hypothetical protein A2583_12480 [Bdellovibrionales bacterium RIFOXYD1_FULL_53_11]|nr:MAG: hypothetical protein A2583_12480 [Bdellovibrionales bacterium RIFOXYD1_FULL_53_11]
METKKAPANKKTEPASPNWFYRSLNGMAEFFISSSYNFELKGGYYTLTSNVVKKKSYADANMSGGQLAGGLWNKWFGVDFYWGTRIIGLDDEGQALLPIWFGANLKARIITSNANKSVVAYAGLLAGYAGYMGINKSDYYHFNKLHGIRTGIFGRLAWNSFEAALTGSYIVFTGFNFHASPDILVRFYGKYRLLAFGQMDYTQKKITDSMGAEKTVSELLTAFGIGIRYGF